MVGFGDADAKCECRCEWVHLYYVYSAIEHAWCCNPPSKTRSGSRLVYIYFIYIAHGVQGVEISIAGASCAFCLAAWLLGFLAVPGRPCVLDSVFSLAGIKPVGISLSAVITRICRVWHSGTLAGRDPRLMGRFHAQGLIASTAEGMLRHLIGYSTGQISIIPSQLARSKMGAVLPGPPFPFFATMPAVHLVTPTPASCSVATAAGSGPGVHLRDSLMAQSSRTS